MGATAAGRAALAVARAATWQRAEARLTLRAGSWRVVKPWPRDGTHSCRVAGASGGPRSMRWVRWLEARGSAAKACL